MLKTRQTWSWLDQSQHLQPDGSQSGAMVVCVPGLTPVTPGPDQSRKPSNQGDGDNMVSLFTPSFLTVTPSVNDANTEFAFRHPAGVLGCVGYEGCSSLIQNMKMWTSQSLVHHYTASRCPNSSVLFSSSWTVARHCLRSKLH